MRASTCEGPDIKTITRVYRFSGSEVCGMNVNALKQEAELGNTIDLEPQLPWDPGDEPAKQTPDFDEVIDDGILPERHLPPENEFVDPEDDEEDIMPRGNQK